MAEATAGPLTPDEINELRMMQAALPAEPRAEYGGVVGDILRGTGWAARTVGNAVSEAFSGTKRKTGDYEEFQPWDAGFTQGIAAGLANASVDDPVGYANAMKNWLPGSDVTFDVNNNPLIKWQGKTYYANKPGVSGNDMMRLATDMGSYWPAARWAATGTSLLTKGLKGGTLSAFTNLVQQLGGQQLGSEQDVSLGSVAVAGGAGVASEVLAPFLGKPAVQLWDRLGRGKIVGPNGSPTPFGRQFVEQVGLDADTITGAMWKALDQFYVKMDASAKGAMKAAMEAGQAVPEAALAQARGATNAALGTAPGAIPKTAGQATRGQEQLDFEEMARTGRMGVGARNVLSDFDRQQSQAVMGQADQLQAMAGGGAMRAQTPEGLGQVVSEGVRGAEERAWKGVGAAYDAVPEGVRLSADPLMGIPNSAAASLRQLGIFPDRAGFEIVYPRTAKALNDIRTVMQQKMAMPPSKRSFGLMELEQERKALNVMLRGADGPDMMALSQLKRTFDAHVEKTWDDALLKGDDAALDQLKLARQSRTEYARLFEPENVDSTVTNTLQKMIQQPDIDNNQVVNWILGTTEAGFGKAGLQMTKQLAKIFGKNSPEFQAVREAAMMKIIYGGGSSAMRDAAWNADKVVSKSSGQLLRRLDNFLDLQGSQVMKEMFTKPELDQIRRFRYELRQIQPGENAATLKTGASMALWLGKVGSWIDGAIRMKAGGLPVTPMQSMGEVATGLSNRAKAMSSVQGWPAPNIRSIPVFSAFLTGASTGASGGYNQPQPQPQGR